MIPLLLVTAEAQEQRVSCAGHSFVVQLDARRDPSVRVYRDKKLVWSGIKKAWKPWKLVVHDVEADGRPDFSVGLVKGTKFMPQPHNCLYVYGIGATHVVPKWRGSSLGQPFHDFVFVRRPKQKPLLVTVNSLLDGRKCLAGYVWVGFGFQKEWQQGSWKEMEIVRTRPGGVVIRANGKDVVVGLEDK